MKNYHIYQPQQMSPTTSKKKKLLIGVGVAIVLGLILVATWWFFFRTSNSADQQNAPQADAPQRVAVDEGPTMAPLPDLQPVVDKWVSSSGGTTSVVITDSSGKQLASHNPSQTYFAASIYKLYVAYAGYQKIDSGIHRQNEPYLSGYTRGTCLDLMIRDSHSPCGEKMWAELGKANLTQQMKGYGLKNTDLTGLQTTAEDAAIILTNIATGKDLKPASQTAYLDSMQAQDTIYRRGLPSGFKSLAVYNKVGWNLDKEWHDAAIVETKDGQKVIVSVFTSGVGYRSIAVLGQQLEKALQ